MGKLAYARKIALSRDVAQLIVYSISKGSVEVLYSRTYIPGQPDSSSVEKHYAGYREYLKRQGWVIADEPGLGWVKGGRS